MEHHKTQEVVNILVTGGSGFLAKTLIKRLIESQPESKIVALARNEGNLIKMKQEFPSIKMITGDISDLCVCQSALKGIDKVYHLAAFKHVGQAEVQPYQCTLSNVVGTINLLARFEGKLFLAISTDKAAQVNGVYGATKFLMERLIAEQEMVNTKTEYRVVRYGNVLYSTGSVLCKWKKILEEGGEIVVTDPNATRFFWTAEQAVDLIFDCEQNASDATPYCPEMKSMEVGVLLDAMQAKYGKAKNIRVIGLQPGENLHEKIMEDGLSSNEVERYTVDEIIELI